MQVEEKEFLLKDGRKAILRSPREEDIEGMLIYLYKSAEETDFLLRIPQECNKYTEEGERKLFERINASDHEAMLVCIVDGKLAGNCDISWSRSFKTKHRASIGIALLKEFWNQGIGTRFMKELIDIAQENEEILQVELSFIEGNSRARALYEKMGFRISAVHPDAVRMRDGTLRNEYFMVRKMKREEKEE